MKFHNIKTLAVLLFLLSGICGLVYEVAWAKYLTLFIGSTAYSHMIVLATYMGGLALGAFVFGRYSDKVSNHLRLYGLLEIGIGFYCLAYPFVIAIVGEIFIKIATLSDASSTKGVLLFLKFILSFTTLIIPTFLMGGTLPVLTKFLSKSISDSGKEVAKLYYINCFGAVIGTGLAGFYLIRTLGLDYTIWVASLINIFIGIVSILAARNLIPTIQESKKTRIKVDENQNVYSEATIRIAIFTAFACGFIAMLYQLVWIRLLSNILGSTTYSFTVMLISFISGIGIGSLIVSFVIKKIKNLIIFLGACQLVTAITMILILPLYERLPFYLLKLADAIPNQPENFSTFLLLESLFCFLIMIVPTIFSGMSLPIVSQIANRDMKVLGKSIGGIFSVNTIGSVVGVLVTGLLLIPLIGIKMSIELGVLLNGLLGLYIIYKTELKSKFKLVLAISFVFLAAGYRILFPIWNDNFLISGVFRNLYKQGIPSYKEFVDQQNEGQKILWYKEGVDANVSVRESKFGNTLQKTLVINGKADASTVADLQTQVLLGQIPLMLYPNDGDALVIGLGSGITCGSVLRHPVKSLDVIEIASEVVECNSFFTKENYNFLEDDRVKIFIDDAITQLKTSSKKYDYIISEPSNPWIAGIGNLFSLEFFNVCKERLNSNGVLAQWFHTYDVNNDIFKLVLSTINEVFPFVTIWKIADSDIIILASANPIAINYEAMELKMKHPQIAKDLARIKMFDVPTLLSTQVVSARNNPYKYIKGDINKSKKPILEFLAPVALFTHESVTILDSLDERYSFKDKNLFFSEYEKQNSLSFENYLNIARFRNTYHTNDLAIAYTALRKCLELEPRNKEALSMFEKATIDLGLPNLNSRKSQLNEFKLMYELNQNDISAVFNFLNALVEYYRIDNSIVNPQTMNDVVELMQKSKHNIPNEEERFQYILAMILTGAGRYFEASIAFEELLKYQNQLGTSSQIISRKDLIYNIGECYYYSGNLKKAEEYFEQLKSMDSSNENILVMKKKLAIKKAGLK